jgi:serine/threonine-protein kinase PknG
MQAICANQGEIFMSNATISCTATAGCSGVIDDGFCNVCGMEHVVNVTGAQAAAAPDPDTGKTAPSASARTGSRASRSTAFGTALSGLSRSASTGTRRGKVESKTVGSRRHLGNGLIELFALPKADPEKAVMAKPEVPISKRYCSNEQCVHNDTPLFDAAKPEKAKEKGFCLKCGTPYNFKPGLAAGDMVADQYQVKGPIAFGGMGWIYLALDTTLNRWVVLKGLLNSEDPVLAEAAVAERQYLAEVKHANIVGIYTFVKHLNAGYIVMEYVGGKMLKSLRKDRGPLPVAEAIAYIHRTLGAFAYMHRLGLVYCDFKPDNIMLEEDDIKVIDLGGVMRLGSNAAPVGTRGYYAPEVPKEGASVVSDLYTIARSLWVLICEPKGYQNPKQFQFALPTAEQEPVFAKYESVYKWLLKGTHEKPEMRFQSADEMADQLLGVMREVVAVDSGTVKPGESTNFGGDPLAIADLESRRVDTIDALSLPALKRSAEDPATGFIVTNLAPDAKKQVLLFESAIEQFPDSGEAVLGLARAHILLGQYAEAETSLAHAETRDPYDWRVIWYRGLSFLAQQKFADAQAAFETCYDELPGDLAPKLAIALSAELDGDVSRAVELFTTVAVTDPSYATACFGLARCLARAGKRTEAVAALTRIPQSSSLFTEARKTVALTLLALSPTHPGEAELSQAARVVEEIALAGVAGVNLVVSVFTTAVDLLKGKQLTAAPGVKLLGQPLVERDLRFGLEKAYRDLARLETDATRKIALIDLANSVRPRTTV